MKMGNLFLELNLIAETPTTRIDAPNKRHVRFGASAL
jgi:hypothetical protein